MRFQVKEVLKPEQPQKPDASRLFITTKSLAAYRLLSPFWLRRVALFFALVAVAVYLFLSFEQTIASPSLVVENPANNLEVNEQSILVSGTTDPKAVLTINGQRVLLREDGTFEERVPLQPGLNTIRVNAQSTGETTVERVVIRN